jgi:PKD repeat protein
LILKRFSGLLVLGLASGYIGCGGGDLTLPSEGEPAAIAIEWGNGQQARVGTRLTDSLVVKVTDTQSRPVAGATINFAFDDATAGGTADPAQAVTDADGRAWSRLTLGTHVGAANGSASVAVPDGQVPVTTAFTATALPADANIIAALSGQDQTGPVGTELDQPLVVQVTDGFGNPIQGVPVSWSTGNGGSFSESSTTTGADGKTSVSWTLGPNAGPQTASASTEQQLAGSPVTFNATATAGNAAKITKVSGDDQRGAPGSELALPLVVQVLDAQGNPVVNGAVTWVGDGTASPETSNTDGDGKASTRWTIAGPGRNTLNAVVSGVGRATFHATGANSSSTTSITSISPDRSLVGQAVTVAVRVSGSGGTPSGNVTVSGESAAQPCTITLSNGAGSCSLTFTAPGNHKVTASYAGDATFGGSSDEANHQVDPAVPTNQPPTAAFNPPRCVAGTACQFNDGSSDTDGNVVAWTWEFGDGPTSTSDQKNPAHTYAVGGTFTVRLTVRDDDNASSTTVSHDVTVDPAPSTNHPPTAVDDAYTGQPGADLTVPPGGPFLTANDTDPDLNDLFAVAENTKLTANGATVDINENGGFVYHHNPNFTGTSDSFTYTVTDRMGGTDQGTATITFSSPSGSPMMAVSGIRLLVVQAR